MAREESASSLLAKPCALAWGSASPEEMLDRKIDISSLGRRR